MLLRRHDVLKYGRFTTLEEVQRIMSAQSHAKQSHTMTKLSLRGRQMPAASFASANDPRQDWRGFSFGGYWFSYYYFYFSNASPFSAARQVMPG